MRTFRIAALVSIAAIWWAGVAVSGIVVTSQGAMSQLNTTGLPGDSVREFCTLWQSDDPLKGVMIFTNSADTPYAEYRATTTDGGLTWTLGVDTNLANPSVVSADERNPVIRDFDQNGNFVGFFGTKQGVYESGFGPNDVLFRAASGNLGASWSGETLVSFGTGAFPGHTGLNGFIEVFETSAGVLRGYVAMNNTVSGTTTRRVESSDGGLTWTDMGGIAISGPNGVNNVVGANGPVFWFTDTDTGARKMGWFVYGEGSGNRGVRLLISTDEGITWTNPGVFSFLDATIRAGDADFLSDSEVRLFYYRNAGSVPSDRQLWYEDFTLSGMSDIVANNLYYVPGGAEIPEPMSLVFFGTGLAALAGYAWRKRMF